MKKMHRERILQTNVNEYMYSPRYRHVVYTVPISQSQTKHAFDEIAKLASKKEPGKSSKFHSGNLRLSNDGKIYRVDDATGNMAVNGRVLFPRNKAITYKSRNPHETIK